MRSHGRSPIQFLPVALLLTGIVIHGVRIMAFNDDPQRGSAFAMFASVDVGSTREVRVSGLGRSPVSLEIPDTLEDQRKRLADAPSDESARNFGLLMMNLRWKLEDGKATAGGTVAFDQVTVEVVGFEASGRTLTTHLLADAVVRKSGA